MSEIALISTNQIIIKIFTLVTKKLSLKLDVYNSDEFDQSYDYIVIDDEVEIDIKKIEEQSTHLVLLSTKTSTSSFYDSIIKKPFLPSDLHTQLEEIINQQTVSKEVVEEKKDIENNLEETHEEIENIDTESLHQLVDNVVNSLDDVESEEDVSINKSTLGLGGILDSDELNKLGNILNDSLPVMEPQKKDDDEEWIELSKIVDRAIDELEVLANNEIKPINLQINKQNLDEVRPLLRKLNQEVIDALVDGNEITLKLRLEK